MAIVHFTLATRDLARSARFFKEALGLKGVPSAPTLRQRLPLAGNCVPGRCRPARVRPW